MVSAYNGRSAASMTRYGNNFKVNFRAYLDYYYFVLTRNKLVLEKHYIVDYNE